VISNGKGGGKRKPKPGSTEERIKRESRSGSGVKRRKVVVEPSRRSGRVAALAEAGAGEGGRRGVVDYKYVQALLLPHSHSRLKRAGQGY